MPRVPVYEQRVGPRPIDPGYSNLNYRAGADLVGKAVSGLGNDLAATAALVEKEREKEAKVLEDEGDLEYARYAGGRFWDSKKGFMLQQGENALDSAKVLEDLAKKRDEIAGRFQGTSRDRFLARANARLLGWTTEAERHSGQARREIHANVAAGKVKLAADEIGRAPDNPVVLETQTALARDALLRHFRDNEGWPEEKVRAELQHVERELVGTALDGLLAKESYEQASSLLEANRKRMGGAAKLYDAKLKAYYDQREVDGERDRIRAAALVDDAHPWLDAGKLRSAVEAYNGSPEKKRALSQLLEDELSKNRDLQRQAAAERFNEGLITLQKNGWNVWDKQLVGVKTYLQDPANDGAKLWQRLVDKAESERAQRKARRAAASRGTREADELAWRDYLAREDLEERAGLDVAATYGDASRAMQLKIVERQNKDRKIVEGGGLLDWDQAKDVALAEADAVGAYNGKDERADFIGWWSNRYEEFRIAEKRPPTRLETRLAIGEAMLIGDARGGSAWSKNRRRWKVPAGEQWKPLHIDDQTSELAREYLRSQEPSPTPGAQPSSSAGGDASSATTAPESRPRTRWDIEYQVALEVRREQPNRRWTKAELDAEVKRRLAEMER